MGGLGLSRCDLSGPKFFCLRPFPYTFIEATDLRMYSTQMQYFLLRDSGLNNGRRYSCADLNSVVFPNMLLTMTAVSLYQVYLLVVFSNTHLATTAASSLPMGLLMAVAALATVSLPFFSCICDSTYGCTAGCRSSSF